VSPSAFYRLTKPINDGLFQTVLAAAASSVDLKAARSPHTLGAGNILSLAENPTAITIQLPRRSLLISQRLTYAMNSATLKDLLGNNHCNRSPAADREENNQRRVTMLGDDSTLDFASDGTVERIFRSKPKGPVASIFIHAGAGYHSIANEKIHLGVCAE
jgi:hypothetical protein